MDGGQKVSFQQKSWLLQIFHLTVPVLIWFNQHFCMYAHKGTQPHQDCQWLPSSWQQNAKSYQDDQGGHAWPRNAYLSILPVPNVHLQSICTEQLTAPPDSSFLRLLNILVCSSACYLPIGSPPPTYLSYALLCIIRADFCKTYSTPCLWAVKGKDENL